MQMARQRYRDSDPVAEILNIALKNEGLGTDASLRQRLLASASELGISEEAALAAEQQWLEQQTAQRESSEYREHVLRGLYTHLGVYVVINLGLVLMNMLTTHGSVTWAYWPILGWGIGLGSHLVAALVQFRSPGGEEYEEWQKGKRKSGMTIGVHVGDPRNRDESLDRS